MSEEQQVFQEDIAADGSKLPQMPRTAGGVIDLLEDGQLAAELYHAMTKLAAQIEEVADHNGGKAKGDMTLKINLAYEDGMFKVSSDFATKAPKMPRPKSVLWTDHDGNFTRFPPGQRQLLGLGNAGHGGSLRTA